MMCYLPPGGMYILDIEEESKFITSLLDVLLSHTVFIHDILYESMKYMECIV